MCTSADFVPQDLADFDVTLTQTQEWCDGKAVEKITLIRCNLNLNLHMLTIVSSQDYP